MRLRTLVVFASLLSSSLSFAQSPSAAELYNKGMNALTGIGQSRSDTQALDLLRRSAEMGYAPAQVAVGYLYETGTVSARNPSEAANWYKKAAQQGDALAQWILGRMIYNGTGVVRDSKDAEAWLQQSADQGSPFGQYLLGLVREARDYTGAATCFRKAAEQGLPHAQQKLALALKNGRGVDVDRANAYVWFLLSYEAGMQSSAADLQELEAELGSTGIEKAKNTARELQRNVQRSATAHGCTGWPGELDEMPRTPPLDLQRYCR